MIKKIEEFNKTRELLVNELKAYVENQEILSRFIKAYKFDW